ncbi:MAG TPA: regulator, partial [Plasticicumulans sp.]|nr:regulator [Plasticicumulans sp.]
GEQDAGGWQAGVEALEAAWFAPLAQALARREIARLTLDTGAQRWSVRAGDLWKFWRRQPAAACFSG